MQSQNTNKPFNGANLTGRTFGMITVLEHIGPRGRWKCQCTCGKVVTKTTTNINRGIRRGEPISCGHARKTHGMARSPERIAWDHMIRRRTNPDSPEFPNYGGRGIVVCERWMLSFSSFFADMGLRPSTKHTLERVDNNAGYCPENCRWATSHEQNRNRRNNHKITFNGETLCLEDWAIRYNINRETLRARLARNWPTELALTRPPSPLPH